jgi:hypothetical protein
MRSCLRIVISTYSFSWNRRPPQLLLRRPKQMICCMLTLLLVLPPTREGYFAWLTYELTCLGRVSYRMWLAYGKVVPRCLVLCGGVRSDHEDNTLLMAREGRAFPQSSRDDHMLKRGRHVSNVVEQWLINTWHIWTSHELGICSEHKQQTCSHNFIRISRCDIADGDIVLHSGALLTAFRRNTPWTWKHLLSPKR